MKIKTFSITVSLGLALLTFLPTAEAGTYVYSATDFQSTACLTGSEFTQLNLTSIGDIVTIRGTGFDNRNLDDSIPETVYVPLRNGILGVNRSLRVDGGGQNTYFGLLSWTDSEIQLELPVGNIGSYIILRKYSSATDQGTCTRGTLATYVSPPPTCTAFTYSDWSACTDSQQTRTATSSSPTGCAGGSPVLTQSCTVAPPTCTSWTYSEWNACTNGQQTRTVATSSPTNCTGGSPVLNQSCTPACTDSDWSCSEWGPCSATNTQTRPSCTKLSTCEGGVSMPPTSQSCTYAPTCTSWTYSNWSECSAAGQRTRTILSSSPTSCNGGNPELTMICTPPTACTADTWTCGEWSTCSADGSQTRTCTLTFDCAGVDTPSPATTQACTYNGPTIASIAPATIYQGTSVTLSGTKFMNLDQYQYSCYTCKVLVNDQEVLGLYSFSWYNDKVSFTIPSTAQSGYIQVQDSKGNKSNKFNFTISQDPTKIPPTVTSISPKIITPGDTITIVGSNFGSTQESSKVITGAYGGSGTIVSWTDNEIKYKTSSYSDTASKKIGVEKCKTFIDCINVVYGGYFYIQPKITSLSISTGAVGTSTKINGSYLKNSNLTSDEGGYYYLEVLFNGTPADVIAWESNYIDAVIPDGATDGPISLKFTADNVSTVLTATGPHFDILEAISNDTYSAYQNYFKQINIPQAWGVASNRQSIVVAVIDDGIHNSHPDLQNNLWINNNERAGNGLDDDGNGYIDDTHGWDFVYNTKDIAPNGSHGTSVAGIIGAIADNGIGIAGVNKNVKLMPLIVCDRNGGCSTNAAIKAIKYAVDNGAKVINLSFGSTGAVDYTAAYDEIVKYAYDRNVIIVAAAGNGNPPYGDAWDLNIHPQSPVCNDNGVNMVIGVGAVDDDNKIPKWSNRGSKCVDIYAPGVDILSTSLPSLRDYHNQLTSIDGNGYYSKASGTSFSAPIIAGIVSLLKATYPTMTSQEAIRLFVNNANGGIVDAYKTLSANFTPASTQIIQTPVYSNPVSNPVSNPTPVQNPVNNPVSTPVASSAPNTAQENYYRPLIESDATSFGVPLTAAQARDVTNFVVYSTSQSTQNLGSGERRAVIRDYFETVVRGNVDWGDIERMVNGQKVVSRNIAKEQAQLPFVLKTFEKVFGHRPNFQDPKEDLSWNTMMYRIRFSRDLDKERNGINRFKSVFRRLPDSPLDWSVVRALGYVI